MGFRVVLMLVFVLPVFIGVSLRLGLDRRLISNLAIFWVIQSAGEDIVYHFVSTIDERAFYCTVWTVVAIVGYFGTLVMVGRLTRSSQPDRRQS